MDPLKEFGNWLIANGYSDNSQRVYRQRIRDFLQFIDNGEITEKAVQDYLVYLIQNKELKSRSINGYTDAISTFLKFRKIRVDLPRRHKTIKRLPNAISQDQLEQSIIPMAYETFSHPEKAVAIIDLAFKSGLRRSEIAALKRCDIDFDNLRGKTYSKKGKRERIFYFDSVSRIRMLKYFSSETEKKNAFNTTEDGIYYYFYKLKKECFKEMKFHPHLMRSSIATKLRNEGAGLDYIQDFLDHQDISTTRIYAGINDGVKQKVYLEIMEGKKEAKTNARPPKRQKE